MTKLLSTSRALVPAPGTAIKKAAKKSAKHDTSAAPPKKHKKHEHEDRHEKHDEQADRRRAWLHLARAASLLASLPRNNARQELSKLHTLAEDTLSEKSASAKVAAETARALEHLCFASLAATHSEIVVARLDAPSAREFERHFQHDLEKQTERLADVAESNSTSQNKRSPLLTPLLTLAHHSIATAERSLADHDWRLAHEYLRAADAMAKAIADL